MFWTSSYLKEYSLLISSATMISKVGLGEKLGVHIAPVHCIPLDKSGPRQVESKVFTRGKCPHRCPPPWWHNGCNTLSTCVFAI